MLEITVSKRISAADALDSEWIKQYSAMEHNLDEGHLATLSNLKTFT